MIPESVEKANASGSIRVGFDLIETDAFSEDIAYGDYVQYEWTLTKSEDNWLLGDGEKYVKFTDTSNKGVTATLEEEGDILTINGTANAYTFEGETYVLNYNVRGVINGYKEKPAKFSIYKHNCAFDQNVVIDEAYKKGADCENAAIYYMSCTCGKISTNEVDVFTYGEVLGHDWTEASCTEPATCKRCESTEGTALGHDWTEASCTEPATCKRCDSTEGTALGHDWTKASCTEPATCKRCNSTEGTANGHVISGWKSDKDGHWTECETVGCGTIISSKENHKYGDDNICDTCGYTIKVTPTTDPTEGTNNTGGIGNTSNNDNISGTGTVVSTGDNNTIWMWIALLAVSGMGTVSLLVKRRQKL